MDSLRSIPMMVCGDLLFIPGSVDYQVSNALLPRPMSSVSMAARLQINRLIYQCPRYSKCSAIHLYRTRLAHNSSHPCPSSPAKPAADAPLRKVNLLRVNLALKYAHNLKLSSSICTSTAPPLENLEETTTPQRPPSSYEPSII